MRPNTNTYKFSVYSRARAWGVRQRRGQNQAGGRSEGGAWQRGGARVQLTTHWSCSTGQFKDTVLHEQVDCGHKQSLREDLEMTSNWRIARKLTSPRHTHALAIVVGGCEVLDVHVPRDGNPATATSLEDCWCVAARVLVGGRARSGWVGHLLATDPDAIAAAARDGEPRDCDIFGLRQLDGVAPLRLRVVAGQSDTRLTGAVSLLRGTRLVPAPVSNIVYTS